MTAVIFHIGPTARLGWRGIVAAGPDARYDVLVDATSGAVIRRVNMVLSANAASVYPAWPDAPAGGSPVTVDLAPYLDDPGAPTKLEGPYAHAFTDATDVVPGFGLPLQTTPAPGSEVGPSSGTDFVYPFTGLALGAGRCPTSGATCAWDPEAPFSWQGNRGQDAVQLFWLVNSFHDHLAAPPIGFTAADGAFEGDDPILAQSMDGANTSAGLPDGEHVDNANFSTWPDGTPGSMQMYLFGGTGGDPFFQVSGSDDSEIVYHEYSHGLSNRLITDASGYGALGSLESGAMGEAWSDWYAFDELDRGGNLVDAPGVADLRVGTYVAGTQDLVRSEPMDCAVATSDPACPGTQLAGTGGYTFGDLGRVAGFPEVHADGEIWAQTLWQLRAGLIADHGRAAGIARAEQLVTDAMRLSPPTPSFLDERNAILQADAADAPAGQDADRIWQVFAARGMGWHAYEDEGGFFGATPYEDFKLPPSPADGSATVQGVVEADGIPLPGIDVAFRGHDTGVGPHLSATTGDDGRYEIPDVPASTYPKFRAAIPAGYAGATAVSLTVPGSGTVTHDFLVNRNWGSGPGGASVRSVVGGSGLCDVSRAIDDDPTTSWSTSSPTSPYSGGTKQFVLALPADVTVTRIAIDPTPHCLGSPEAELRDYRIKVARDDEDDPGPFRTVASGRFEPSDLGSASDIDLSSTVAGVRYVELQALSNHGDDFAMEIAELQVFGHLTTPAEGGGGTAAPEVATLDADGAATTASSVTFRAGVAPHGLPTVVRIEFGLASGQLAYQTADVPVPGDAPRTVKLATAGLLPNTVYHYRAVATSSRGTVAGAERTVKTASAPVLAPVTTPGPVTQPVTKKTTCRIAGTSVTCTLSPALKRTNGARGQLMRTGRTYARGTVKGHALRMRRIRAVRPGSYVLKLTSGTGRSALVRRLSVKL
jgi:hypothetical protein